MPVSKPASDGSARVDMRDEGTGARHGKIARLKNKDRSQWPLGAVEVSAIMAHETLKVYVDMRLVASDCVRRFCMGRICLGTYQSKK